MMNKSAPAIQSNDTRVVNGASLAALNNLASRGRKESTILAFIKESGPTWVNSPRPKEYEAKSNGVSVFEAFAASKILNS